MTDSKPDKHPGGRPLKFPTVKALQKAIDAYFAECDREEDTRVFKHDKTFEWVNEESRMEVRCKRCRGLTLDKYGLPTTGCILVKGRLKEKLPYTITGLALAIGFKTRMSLLEYEGEVEGREKSPEFADAVKEAKARCENYLENRGLYGDMAPAKATFGLSNYGWKNPAQLRIAGDPDNPTPIPHSLSSLLDQADGK